MFKFLSSISPIAVLLLGAIPAGAAGWFAHGIKFDWIDRPSIIREATATADAACAIRVSKAATAAETAERARQRAASADARRIYEEALNASERAALAAESQLEQEIADHEAQLAMEGRSCSLTGPDIDSLYRR